MLSGDPGGWDGVGEREVQEGGDIDIHIADSLHCTEKLTQHCKSTIPPILKNGRKW